MFALLFYLHDVFAACHWLWLCFRRRHAIAKDESAAPPRARRRARRRERQLAAWLPRAAARRRAAVGPAPAAYAPIAVAAGLLTYASKAFRSSHKECRGARAPARRVGVAASCLHTRLSILLRHTLRLRAMHA